jgi:chemotaxis protein methyltransferase CheR
MPREVRERLFRQDQGKWLIHERYRGGVAFQYHNLVKDVAPSLLNNLFAFDLILCRNVMIYFDRTTVAAVVDRLWDCVVDRGWLVVGHADIDPQAFRAFQTLSESGVTVYRKAGTPAAEPAATPGAAGSWAVESDGPGPETGKTAPVELPSLAKPDPRPAAPSDRRTTEDLRALADQGAWAEAANYCSLLLESAPLDPVTHFYNALILEHMGRLAEAEKSLRRSIYLERRFVLGHYHLGLLLQRNREASSAARRCFDNVLALLESIEDDFQFGHGDGITAAGLRELTEMHLEVL